MNPDETLAIERDENMTRQRSRVRTLCTDMTEAAETIETLECDDTGTLDAILRMYALVADRLRAETLTLLTMTEDTK